MTVVLAFWSNIFTVRTSSAFKEALSCRFLLTKANFNVAEGRERSFFLRPLSFHRLTRPSFRIGIFLAPPPSIQAATAVKRKIESYRDRSQYIKSKLGGESAEKIESLNSNNAVRSQSLAKPLPNSQALSALASSPPTSPTIPNASNQNVRPTNAPAILTSATYVPQSASQSPAPILFTRVFHAAASFPKAIELPSSQPDCPASSAPSSALVDCIPRPRRRLGVGRRTLMLGRWPSENKHPFSAHRCSAFHRYAWNL